VNPFQYLLPKGWDRQQQRKPFHNEKRKLARKKPQRRGNWARRNLTGRDIPWVVRL
jgi:hypothetical protein